MRAVWLSFFQMAAAMRRDMMLAAACFVPVLAGIFFRFGIPPLEAAFIEWLHAPEVLSPYYKLIDVFFAMLSPAMFCFVSAMVSLEEADEKTAEYLFVTPLGKLGYLSARLGIPAAVSYLGSLILLLCFKLTFFSLADALALAAGGTLQGLMAALLVLTFSSNRLEGMAVAKLSTLTLSGAAIPFFLPKDWQYIFSPLPSFWMGKAAYENRSGYMLPMFGLSALWLWFFLRRYLCRRSRNR